MPEARADEMQYALDNPNMIMLLDIATARKTKTWERLMMVVKKDAGVPEDPFFKKIIESDLRVTWSFTRTRDNPDSGMVVVFTAQKPLTIAGVWAWFAPIVKDNPAELPKFTEIKHGGITIYDLPSPMFIDGKYVVVAMMDHVSTMEDKESPGVKVLKKIIDRNKKPAALSPAMTATLKEAPLTSMACLALDFKAIPADAQADILSTFEGGPKAFADIKANAGKISGLAIALEEKANTKLTGTLVCADKAAAGTFKGIAVAAVRQLKTELAKFLKEATEKKDEMAVKSLEAVDKALGALTISAAGNNVVAAVAMEPSDATMALLLYAMLPRAAEKRSKEDVARVQCKVLENAVNTYQIRNKGTPPASLEALKQGTKDNPPILEKNAALIDPWGNPYQLEVLPSGEVVVSSHGPPGGPRITSRDKAAPPKK